MSSSGKTLALLCCLMVALATGLPAMELPTGQPSDPSTEQGVRERLQLVSQAHPIREPTADENRAICEALEHLRELGYDSLGENGGVLEEFIFDHPENPWRYAAAIGLGQAFRRAGYHTRGERLFQVVWDELKNGSTVVEKVYADHAHVELLHLKMWVGDRDGYDQRQAAAGDRILHSSVAHRAEAMGEARALMDLDERDCFKCGPYALMQIGRHLGLDVDALAVPAAVETTTQGTSLMQNQRLARQMGLDTIVAIRAPGAEVITPAVIHWNRDHFGALLESEAGKVRFQDSTAGYFYGKDRWIEAGALDTDGSGFFLIQRQELPAGWRQATDREAAEIWGKGLVDPASPHHCTPCHKATPGSGCSSVGMPTYNINLVQARLAITDTPMAYTPARGPAVVFSVRYIEANEGEDIDGQHWAGFIANNWRHNWMSGVIDTINSYYYPPDSHNQEIKVYVPGGGVMTYQMDGANSVGPHPVNGTTLHRVNARVVNGRYYYDYELRFPDGSFYTYGHRRENTALGKSYCYLSKMTDANGHALTASFAPNMNLSSITDANQGVTRFTYHSGSRHIKTVTDPLGRTIEFEVVRADTFTWQLRKIRDMAGLTNPADPKLAGGWTAAFEYSANNNVVITGMTTPYGTTAFERGEAIGSKAPEFGLSTTKVVSRWVKATDPHGDSELVHYIQESTSGNKGVFTGIDWGNEPSPSEIMYKNGYLNYRNVFYFDKEAYHAAEDANGNLDYAKAHVYHWLHSMGTLSDILESEKAPLENRIWYAYEGATAPTSDSGIRVTQPSHIAQVLPNGEGTSLTVMDYDDVTGVLLSRTDPEGRKIRYEYDVNGQDVKKVWQVTASGEVLLAEYQYDPQRRILKAWGPDRNAVSVTYNANGDLATVTDPLNRTVTYGYDANGYLESVTDWVQRAVSFTYQTVNGYKTTRVETATNPENQTITYAYDALDRVTTVTLPDGRTVETVYEYLHVDKQKDVLGRWTDYEQDALGRVVKTIAPDGSETLIEWCRCGDPRAIIDALGRRTHWVRDVQGRVVEKRYPDADGAGPLASVSSFIHYDMAGRIERLVDGIGQETHFDYYKDGRIKQVDYLDASQAAHATTPSVSFTYDADFGFLESMADGEGLTQYEYWPVDGTQRNGAGRVRWIRSAWDDSADIELVYDALGRSTTVAVGGDQRTVTFDNLDRVEAVTNALGSFTHAYDGDTSRLISMARSGGITTSFSYGPKASGSRLESIHHLGLDGDPSQTISRFGYGYRADGTIARWHRQLGSNSAADVSTFSFDYDRIDQLTAATLTGADGTVQKTYAYAYDAAGNRTVSQVDSKVVTHDYNAINQRISSQAGGPLRVGGTVSEPATVTINGSQAMLLPGLRYAGSTTVSEGSQTVTAEATDAGSNVTSASATVTVPASTEPALSYDANGNLIASGSRSFEWDAANRLLAVVDGTHRSEFSYNGLGQRVRIVEKENGVVQTDRRFLWLGAAILEERADGVGTGDVVVKRFFGQGVVDGGAHYFYTRDHLGSIREVVDGSGAVVARYDYSPYGGRKNVSGNYDADFGFTGHLEHGPSGLTLTWFRAYDASDGFWLNRDPLGEASNLNLYGYGPNNPTGGYDPDGRAWHIVFGAGIGAIVGGFTGGWKGAIAGAIGGAVTAATFGAGAGVLSGVGAKAGLMGTAGEIGIGASFGLGGGCGVAGSLAQSSVESALSAERSFFSKETVTDAAISGVMGGLGGGAGGVMDEFADEALGGSVSLMVSASESLGSGALDVYEDVITHGNGRTAVVLKNEPFRRNSFPWFDYGTFGYNAAGGIVISPAAWACGK